jgi:hypothetical protein
MGQALYYWRPVTAIRNGDLAIGMDVNGSDPTGDARKEQAT